jgi:hypothetical protein
MTMVDAATLEGLWEYLWWHHRGRARAVKSSYLRRRFNLSNRELIEATRRLNIERGKPVCASTRGKWRGIFAARSPAELAEYAEDLRRRSLGIFERQAAIRRILARFEGQAEFDFERA